MLILNRWPQYSTRGGEIPPPPPPWLPASAVTLVAPSTSQRDSHCCLGCNDFPLWLRSRGQYFAGAPTGILPCLDCVMTTCGSISDIARPTCRGNHPLCSTITQFFRQNLCCRRGLLFPCFPLRNAAISFYYYSRPNADSSYLQSHFVRRMLPHAPAVHVRGSLLEEEECEILDGR